jgi:hypothetical protein
MPKQRKRPAHMGGKPLHSSFRGVTYEPKRNKPWKAYMRRAGKLVTIGHYSNESEARDARAAALRD